MAAWWRRGKVITACVALSAALVGGTTSPAQAHGGADVWIRSDGVWRTQTWSMTDSQVPSACPGPTSQSVTVTATMKGTSTAFTIQSIYIKNTTSGVNFSYNVDWSDRLYWASPIGSWPTGATRRLNYWTNGGTVSLTQSWYKNLGIHTLTLENGGGIGCWPDFQMIFHRW